MKGESMSYVTPNSDLYILYDVPLDTTYEHSIYFSSPTAQYNYFHGKVRWTFSELTYQRVNRGYIRVEKNAEDLYNCNYLMFRNTAFGTKWFYAFITSIDYISNGVSQVNYVIDFIQTWLFEFSFNSCFIERTHTETDEIGEHYEPEPVAIGEYVLNDYQMLDSELSELGIVTSTTEVDTNGEPEGNLYEGIYSGSKLRFFRNQPANPSQVVDAVNRFLKDYVGTPDNVTGMYMCPYKFIQTTIGIGNYDEIDQSSECYHTYYSTSPVTVSDTLDGYKPRNRKLYSYPYNFLHVDNGGSSELSLRYEFFESQVPMLELNGSFIQPVQAILYPKNYKGVTGVYDVDNAKVYNPESIILTDYPYCSWNFDSYKQWTTTQVPANAIRQTGKLANNFIGSAGSFLTGMETNSRLKNFSPHIFVANRFILVIS